MKQRKSLLWIYIVLGSMVLETVLVALCFFGYRLSSHDISIVTRLLNQMIHWWKYSFVAVLLAAFCRMKKYPPHTVKEYFNGEFSLFLLLFLKIIYDMALLAVPEIVYVGFSWEYLWICFERMVFYVGAFGAIAIVLGTIAAKIPVRGAGYALTGFAAVFVTSILVDFDYYNIINPYNPCPIKNPLVFEEKTKWHADKVYGGSLYEEYQGDMEHFRVTDYKLSVWIANEHLLRGEAVMKLSDGTLSEYIFRLNNYMQVEEVTDGTGNELNWKQEGNYVVVSGGGMISEITMNYYCDDDYIIPVENHYVSLPSYLMWYPAAPDTKSDYFVEVHFDYGVYCNLEELRKNSFQGTANTVSLLSGTLVGETFVKDVRIIYPKLRFSEYYIRQYYLTQIVQVPKNYGKDVEGFDWFYDDWINSSFRKYYDLDECLTDGYMY